jgi:hypothetical protein
VNVIRQVFAAAGVAGLAAYVTQRALDHTSSLTAALQAHAPTGNPVACLASATSARAGCVQRQATVMGLNDGFFTLLVWCALAIILALLVGRDPTLEWRRVSGPALLARTFPHLSRRALVEAAGAAQALSFETGQVIVQQGDVADRFYIITSGEVSVMRRSDAGLEVELERLGPGQFFGEIGLLANMARTATVTATHPLKVLALNHADFAAIVSHSPATAGEVRQVMLRRMAIMF